MSEHTPEPWELISWGDGQPNFIQGATEEWVCTFQRMVPEALERQRANAALLVKAPEMAAFIAAYDAWAASDEHCGGPFFHAMLVARDALAPTTGQET